MASKSQLPHDVDRRLIEIILKCTECGNTFKRDGLKDCEIVACPICEADYKVIVREGKTEIVEYVYEGPDVGEL